MTERDSKVPIRKGLFGMRQGGKQSIFTLTEKYRLSIDQLLSTFPVNQSFHSHMEDIQFTMIMTD